MKNLMRAVWGIALTMTVALSVQAAMDDKSIRERTMPVGNVCVEGDDCGAAAAPVAAGPQTPEDIYNSACAACHTSGALNAPKLGDAAAWTARLEKGLEQTIANAINGVGAMPAMGTCGSCSEDDIAATVTYMVDNSK